AQRRGALDDGHLEAALAQPVGQGGTGHAGPRDQHSLSSHAQYYTNVLYVCIEVRIAVVGHKEDLLVGAKRALLEKGYARTTARDIVALSGTNLGSIGYHYGSTEALMTAAMLSAMDDWGNAVFTALSGAGDED